jgi:hypothetical protein
MADEEPTLQAEPPPGWSNSAANSGISSSEGPPTNIDMSGSGWSNNGPPATGATAGTPGTFTPAGADSPDKLAELTGVTAVPATAWTTGQYVLLGDGTFAHWSSTAWVAGKA